ncbi:hypothetical protein [Streptomyces sp. NPDC047453]|uniref:hypothetical protein n=1 Tax=Streptomyces sp. NPDC047453 TaxID=3154812 RepID=UPI0033E08403
MFFLDLFGMSAQPRPVEDALGLLLGALGVAERQLPADPQARASLYRSLLRDRQILVVLDDAASEEQIRPLLAAHGPSRVPVTSRRLLAGLEGVRRLVLGPLQLPEAMDLLTGIVGERSVTDGPVALTRLAQLCGGLPLALCRQRLNVGSGSLLVPEPRRVTNSAIMNGRDRRPHLLQNLWLHQTTDVEVSDVTISANRVTVHAATTRFMPRGGRVCGAGRS